MDKVRVSYDYETESLTVWFDDPQKEHICEEMGNGIVLMKSNDGSVIGFENLYVPLEKGVDLLSVEMLPSC